MKYIHLTRGKYAIVDDDDYEYLSRWKWIANKSRRTWYAVRMIGPTDRRKMVLMHRVILGLREDQWTDHINCNGLDNRRGNLRAATPTQNKRNGRPYRGCASRYKGVSRNWGRWMARITVDGDTKYLGNFATEAAAARAYDAAARKFFGEFARTNFDG